MKVETAVILAAGAGTREFPVTTTIEKCLMPVYAGAQSRPLIDFMVEDCAAAGIRRIIFVASEHSRQQLADYYNPDLSSELRQKLEAMGKTGQI